MRQFFFLLSLIVLVFTKNSISQQLADSISIESTFKGYKFYFRGEEIKAKKVSAIMEYNYDAFDTFESSREAFFFGNMFAMFGTGMIIFPFAASVSGYEANWGYAFTGAGFIGISIPIFISYHKKTASALRIYNIGIQTKNKPQASLKFGATNAGMSLALKF
ncbi:MAG: hypothetical protein JEZ09_09215 [Salinivirgaceae bacterium]|nr:hypothetical protein [Salinivirgaceae bacterium]